MLFINTRPNDRAVGLNDGTGATGMLRSSDCRYWSFLPEHGHELARLYQQLAHTQVIVVVSPSCRAILVCTFAAKPD